MVFICCLVLQVLYLEHSVDSLARRGPWQMGIIMRGKSAWRPLREAETEEYGGSTRRVLYGCAVTMMNGNCRGNAPMSWSFAKVDEYQPLKLPKTMTGLQPNSDDVRSFRKKSGKFGSRENFNMTNDCSTFKQLLLTWSRVCFLAFSIYFVLK